MKHFLLTLPIVCFSATAGLAQTAIGSALDANVGDNRYAVTGETSVTGYWKYTPKSDCLATVAPLPGSTNAPTVGTLADNAESSEQAIAAMRGANAGNYAAVYPLKAGTTYYFSSTDVNEVGFTLALQENANIGGGLSYDNPAPIADGENTYIGNPTSTSYNNYSAYASYTATEDAQLLLTSSSYLMAYVNGNSCSSDYADGKYTLKIAVKSGETYRLTFSINQPVVMAASLAHPEAGSIDMPFDAAEGENEVPADYGTYYYTYTPAKTGYLDISSQDELTGGNVTVYSSKYNLSTNQPAATSESGSFGVRTEVASAGATYYIVVNKIDGTDEAQHFTLKMDDYKAGEKESNPIAIGELPSTVSTEAAIGTYYYSVKIPANTKDLLHVKAEGSVADGTSLAVYPAGNSYSGVYGTDDAKLSVDNGYDCSYIIKWTTADNTAVSFTVELQKVQPGELITNPKDAVLGENTIESDGDKYYAYTATRAGKFSVELGNPESSVSFPRGTDSWSGDYTAIKNGITYSLEATAGTRYLIKIQNCKAGDKFTIAETDFKQGETRENPIAVEGHEFVMGSGQGNVWIKYTATKECQVTVDFDNPEGDAEADGRVNVEFGKENEYMTGMVSTVMSGSTSVNKYHGTKVLGAGESVLVHVSASVNVEGWKVTFAEGDVPQGLSAENPLVLEPGKTLTVSPNSAVWVKAVLGKGENVFTANANNRTMLYTSLDDAKAESNGEYVNYDVTWAPDYMSQTDVFRKTVDAEQTVWFQFMSVSSEFTFEFTSGGAETAVNGIHTEGNAGVEVFTLDGVKVASTTEGLAKGIYVVRQNGKAKKIIVK